MTFGEKLQFLRKSKGMSQEQLSLQIAVSRQAISKWELDASLPDADKIIQLSKLFSVSTDYLLLDEIESYTRVETQKTSDVNIKHRNKAKRIIGYILVAIGTLGNLVLFVLSTMIESFVPAQYTDSQGLIWHTLKPGYAFWPFIEKYRLEAIFIIFCILLLTGLFFIEFDKIKKWFELET